ncbi:MULTISPECIES: aminotransferase class V-fold PLP-dependent enzyme [unclassified Arcicella]|uniref:aminotransferase class V-fold PLP-dependent enzyme n=1 Tax=unclassified Arcicella TaxID=2644986 RepID=UPI002855AE68|nr:MULTISPECIES: aminotransferase class V-fold PLP-dependent enzyme [unclassified Arcicella]MDR6560414.1 selenocysteine lyase/cysteine desulfurase [Arcicella sp. BE51]MDR6809980.1 selenocysteine lyase/cysteine desulfurase [Arcicella sp. BE140]MDR6821329.1 selenocysteine lyase/cysteine desulfurase [Arcicella sp. BE139]
MSLSCQKHLFSLEEGIHYINCATMAPNLKSVEEAGIQGILRKTQPQNITSQSFFETTEPVKNAYAKLINCPDPERIVLLPSSSYGMAIVAKNLYRKPNIRAGQEIVMVSEEFPSDVYAWEEVCINLGLKMRVVHPPASLENRGKIWNEKLLEAITSNTCLVVVSPTHWADGTSFNTEIIGQHCRSVGALLVLDGTQSIGAMPFDVQKVQPDAIINPGYKWLLGPYSAGVAYFGAFFDEGNPLERNWINRVGSEDFKNLINYQTQYRAKADRYNMGERSNFILNPMLTAAIEQINVWGVNAINNYCDELLKEPLDILQAHGYWVEEKPYRSSHLVGVRIPEHIDYQKIQAALQERKVFVSFRGQSIRLAPHLYNDMNDIDVLMDGLLKGIQ